jgi:hypothetical protein
MEGQFISGEWAAPGQEQNVRLQMVLDKSGLELRDGFSTHINLSCLFGKHQRAILFPS